MGEELGNYVHQNMGEELGNYVHQNRFVGHRHTVTDPRPRSSFGTLPHPHPASELSTPTPPVDFWDTDRQTVYMGEELGNYVHQNITVHTDPPRSSFGTDRPTHTQSNIIWGRS